MKTTTLRVTPKVLNQIKELQRHLTTYHSIKLTQTEIVEKGVEILTKNENELLNPKKNEKDPLWRIIENPDKRGPKTNCVKEIDLVVTSG